ncbi:MAG: phage major capsid protein [Chloroflexota bacterium]
MNAVKTIDAATGRVGGYLIVWGDAATKDLEGEYFTPSTDFALDWFPTRPVLYQHGLDGVMKGALVGKIDVLRADEVGVWAEAQLDLHHRYVRAVQALIDRGVLAWSSGSLPHLVEREGDGRISRWPLIEGSLTPTPAEPRYTDVQTVKSAYKALGLDIARLGEVDEPSPQPNANHDDVGTQYIVSLHTDHREHVGTQHAVSLHLQPNTEHPNPTNTKGHTPMENSLKRLPHPADATKTTLPRIEVGSPYDALSAEDLLHGYMLLRNAKTFRGVSERYANALAFKVATKGLSAIKADELSYSTQAGFGDEWVPDLWSAQIWRKARQDNVVLPLFQSIEMPSNPFELPAEGADPTVYYVSETTDESHLTLGAGNTIPDSRIGSKMLTLNAKKLALRVGFSAELVEDAVLPVLNIYREQATRAIADAIDHVLLNGDTSATGNVNFDGGSPAENAKYRALDGVRKTALGNSIDAAGAPTLALLRQARFAMPTVYAARPSDLAWIVDGSTYAKLLGVSEFLTMDKAGPMATALTGQIGFADGAPVMLSAEMPDGVMTNGKVGDESIPGYENTTGSAVCVYRPGWFVGYRRRINVSVDYIPFYDSYQLTATVRLAFVPFENTVASALRNITIS